MKPKPSSNQKTSNCLVTLSLDTGRKLVTAFQRQGIQAVLLPSIETSAIAASSPELIRRAAAIDSYDWFIFISPNAVRYGFDWLQQLSPKLNLESVRLAAVGRATAEQLQNKSGQAVLSPSTGSGAAALLAMDELQSLADTRILIVRGQGGKDELAQHLHSRGAQVDYAELYTRHCPASISEKQLASLTAIKYIIVGSQQGYLNLYDMLGSAALNWLLQRTLLVPNPTVAELVHAKLGLQANTMVLADMNHDTIIHTLKQRINFGG